jgi:NAD-dependent deacetylase
MPPERAAECRRAVELLAGARDVLVITGAGMSQESGVPTFRDAQTGLWARYDPMDLATPEAFRRHPDRVFGWYAWRLRQVRAADPHVGHCALAAMERLFPRLTVVTQNVDGLHRRAGSREVVELHGSLEAFRCADCGRSYDADDVMAVAPREPAELFPPRCPACGGPVRPGVVWFGETLPMAAMERAWSLVRECDMLLVVGTSAVVYPAATLPEVAVARGIGVIEINPEPTPFTPHVTLAWPSTAAVALPQLEAALSEQEEGG